MPRKDDSEVTESKITNDDTNAMPRKRLVDHVEVLCEAVLGSGILTIGQLDRLAPGETLLLDSSPADPADIRVNGKVIARGEVVTVDNRFAIRITEIG